MDQLFRIDRSGSFEDAYFTLCYSPNSQIDQGSKFSITLPLLESVGTPVHGETTVNNSAEGQRARLKRLVQGCRVLVADDNPVNIRLARAVLIKAGCTVHEVSDGKSAVTFLMDSPTACDLVLIDVHMPGMDGLEATKTIREHGSNVPIVALTGNTDESDRAACLSTGMNDFLSKPFTPKALLDIVARHRSGDAPASLPTELPLEAVAG